MKTSLENSSSGKLSARLGFKDRERSQERIEDSLFANCGKNGQSKASGKISLSGSAQKRTFIDQSAVHNVNELQIEVEKWKRFAKIMTDSYEQLNIQSNGFFQEMEQTKLQNSQLEAEVFFKQSFSLSKYSYTGFETESVVTSKRRRECAITVETRSI